MKHIFIINPTAGKQDSRQRIYDMAKELREKHGLDVQCILTKKQGHATEIARKLCEEGGELRFYACGGDGTANEVANGILGFDNAAMTMVPVGTATTCSRTSATTSRSSAMWKISGTGRSSRWMSSRSTGAMRSRSHVPASTRVSPRTYINTARAPCSTASPATSSRCS